MVMTREFVLFVSIVALLSSACGDSGERRMTEDTDERASPAGMPERPTEVELVAWMEAHYGAVILAHDALLQGDVPAFRRELERASKLPTPPGMPADWGPLVERFRSAAGAAQGVTDLERGAEVMAQVVLACGQCHVALGRGPVYPAPAPDDDDDALRAAMYDHQWASERLWEGVTGPWDVAWERGAAALAEGSVFGDASGEVDGDLLRRERALRALGQEAQRTTGHAARARVYGQLLITCGDCHDAAGVTFAEDD
jgi:cytochrome c553